MKIATMNYFVTNYATYSINELKKAIVVPSNLIDDFFAKYYEVKVAEASEENA
jgi:hypothetical protein